MNTADTCQILLVEDDLRLAHLIAEYLTSQGFKVHTETSGLKVARITADICPDLIILDISLPGKNGLQICQDIRSDYHGPIMFLTARTENAEQIQGLESGADDYVLKPVEPQLLLARIKALLRRYGSDTNVSQQEICLGPLQINLKLRTASRGGETLSLSSHEFDLLVTFAKHAGQVLSREYLFSRVYSRPYDGLDRTIDVRISQLRKKLGEAPDAAHIIKTIWGRGYLLVADAL
ncbi:MAG TPA: response regulator transcription factor [Cellvibrionaceae bacterium]|nr:response regulator transcription factor [Cellvibrionaceae bacterium]